MLLDVVADKTGYPKEILTLDMNLELDLGIDSIKRVAILSELQEKLPNAPRITPEQLKSRQGRVRCGQCQNVFNALETLRLTACIARELPGLHRDIERLMSITGDSLPEAWQPLNTSGSSSVGPV